jgi:hypothetical protein
VRTILLALVLSVAGSALAVVPPGTPRPDRIDAVNGIRDTIRCGAGRDIVVADRDDVVANDCEVVTRRIALDRTTAQGAQHRTVVEPSAVGDGSTVVAVFQSGRIVDGGAAAIGWATSTDSGTTWQRGQLRDSGAERVSDPVVARDRVHGVWLAAVLAVLPTETRILIYRSVDGLDWNEPVVAATATTPPRQQIGLDKEWVACDKRPLSPHEGACYLAYTDITAGLVAVRSSPDGGASWSAAVDVGPQGGEGPVGAIPAVEPDGTLAVVYSTSDLDAIETVASSDGGATFGSPVRIAAVVTHSTPLRAAPLPSVAETTRGVVVVWPDCGAHIGCTADDILSAASSDGTTWSPPRDIAGGGDYATPAVGASGDSVAIVAYVQQNQPCCRLGVRLFRSSDDGTTWGAPTRLDAKPMNTTWLARSFSGPTEVAFLGDYMAVAFVGARPVPVFAAALAPLAGSSRQDLYATTRLR